MNITETEQRSKSQKMCLDKKHYSSMIKAYCAVGRLNIRFNKPFRVYSCPVCRGYHLTTQTQPLRQATMEEAMSKV